MLVTSFVICGFFRFFFFYDCNSFSIFCFITCISASSDFPPDVASSSGNLLLLLSDYSFMLMLLLLLLVFLLLPLIITPTQYFCFSCCDYGTSASPAVTSSTFLMKRILIKRNKRKFRMSQPIATSYLLFKAQRKIPERVNLVLECPDAFLVMELKFHEDRKRE